MDGWQTAYSTIAEVAATLTGLLFVALSLRLNTASSDRREWMLQVARRSFFDFLAVLVIALVWLIPAVSILFVGWVALLTAVSRVFWHIHHWRRYRADGTGASSLSDHLVPMIATLMLCVAGVLMAVLGEPAPKLIYTAAIALLFGACRNSWRFLAE
jgi:lipoprotein signal peptidase